MDLPYSTNEDLLQINPKDVTVNIIGYVDEIIPTKTCSGGTLRLFKFYLTNGDLRIAVCVFGNHKPEQDMIDRYETEISHRRIVYLECAQADLPNMKFFNSKDKRLVQMEIYVQACSTLTFLGFHGQNDQNDTEHENVDFESITKARGTVVIEGYLLTKFVLSVNRSTNQSCGIGAITDGVWKMTIQVTNFNSIDIEKCAAVKVTGKVRTDSARNIFLISSDDNCIESMNKQPMSLLTLIKGTKVPKADEAILDYEYRYTSRSSSQGTNSPRTQQNLSQNSSSQESTVSKKRKDEESQDVGDDESSKKQKTSGKNDD